MRDPARTRQRNTDAGLVAITALLVLGLALDQLVWLQSALAAALLAMVWPRAFAPLAFVWFGFSEVLGGVMNRVVMGALFILMVTPVGWLRRLLGKDDLRLAAWRLPEESSLVRREHTFSSKDIEAPY